MSIATVLFSRHRVFSAFLFLLAALVLTAGCQKKIRVNSSNAPATEEPIKELRLGYFGNMTHAQAVLGVQTGEFGQAISPATLKTKVFNAGPSLIEALIAGEIDIGYVGPGPTLNGYLKSDGDIRVLAGAAANGVVIVAGKDSGINTLDDLKGKVIATPQQGNTQDIAARYYLIHTLQQADANNIRPIENAQQLVLLQRGKIDAAWRLLNPGACVLSLKAMRMSSAKKKTSGPASNLS